MTGRDIPLDKKTIFITRWSASVSPASCFFLPNCYVINKNMIILVDKKMIENLLVYYIIH